jgi:hypothetical protein
LQGGCDNHPGREALAGCDAQLEADQYRRADGLTLSSDTHETSNQVFILSLLLGI